MKKRARGYYRNHFFLHIIAIGLITLILSGCAHLERDIDEKPLTVYMAQGEKDDMLSRHAPLFLTYNHAANFNRIGRPSAKFASGEKETIYVDHRRPAVYAMIQHITVNDHQYRNLVYRIHFPKVPFSIIPFHLTAGKNVGLLVIVTLDRQKRPILVTTAGTCGCYVAVVPTSHLPSRSLPKGWKKEPLKVYGETLPSLLDFNGRKRPRLMVHIRSAVHRVMGLEVLEEEQLNEGKAFSLIRAPLLAMEELKKMPIDGKTTSLYHDKGLLKGHVKGSVKPWETLLMSIISLDLFVGTDKVFGDSRITGNPFYTSLKPWNRKASDLWRFERFLRFNGWRL
jgi:hypothetical protein